MGEEVGQSWEMVLRKGLEQETVPRKGDGTGKQGDEGKIPLVTRWDCGGGRGPVAEEAEPTW